MDASVMVTVHRQDVVPENPDERVAWLNAHGTVPEQWQIECVACLEAWRGVGARIYSDGKVGALDDTERQLRLVLAEHLRRVPGWVPGEKFNCEQRLIAWGAEAKAAKAKADEERAAVAAAKQAESFAIASVVLAMCDDDALAPDGTLRKHADPRVQSVLSHYLGEPSYYHDKDAAEQAKEALARLKAAQETRRRNWADAIKRRTKALFTGLVGMWGDPSQVARLKAGRLPVSEVYTMVQEHMMPFEGEYVPLRAADVPHDESCCCDRSDEDFPSFSSSQYNGPLTASQFDRLQAFERVCAKQLATIQTFFDDASMTVQTRMHEGWCPAKRSNCDAGNVERLSLRVRIEWPQAITVEKEFSLD